MQLMIPLTATLTATRVGCTKVAGRINVLLTVYFEDIGSTVLDGVPNPSHDKGEGVLCGLCQITMAGGHFLLTLYRH